jgi:tripartite-type tricarboxylate transporter receptor subunit TctC
MGDAEVRALKVVVAAIVAAVAWTAPGRAQTFPSKPVKVIMPYPTGTGPDTAMRLVGEKLHAYWGQPIVIENRPGANYWTAADAAKKAAPDGYTLFQTENFMMGLQPHVFKKLPFDPVKDFDPVSPMYQTNFFVVVPASSPWKNIPDLVAAAKVKDGALSYGSSGVASHMHIGGAMLESATGIKMTHVPVKETPQVFVSVANGEISWAFGSASTSGPMLRANKVKYLAVAGPKRHPSFPDVPTVAEAGGPPNFEVKAWIALYAPHGTPKAIVDKLNADITRALNEPDVRERMNAVGFTTWTGSPADLAKTLEADSKVLGEVARSQSISLD